MSNRGSRDDISPSPVWWLSPVAIFMCLHLPLIAISFAIPEDAYRTLWRTEKFFNDEAALACVAAVAAFLIGYALPRLRDVKSPFPVCPTATLEGYQVCVPAMRRLFRIGFVLTLIGYTVYFASAAQHGLSISEILRAATGEPGAADRIKRDYVDTVPGISTLTQVAPVVALLAVLIARLENWSGMIVELAILGALTMVRAFLLSERLALLEVVIPAAVLYIRVNSRLPKPGRALPLYTRGWVPGAGAGAVYVLFTVSEYFRSWVTYFAGKDQSLLVFSFYRLVGYYVTAYNNSAYLWHNFVSSSAMPFFTCQWLLRFPILRSLDIGWGDVAAEFDRYMSFLQTGVNPEFNNPGCLLLPIVDYGIPGGLLFWAACGVGASALFKSYRYLRPGGLLVYPIFAIGLLEASRILHWTAGRTFPMFAYAGLSAFVVGRQLQRYRLFAASVESARRGLDWAKADTFAPQA